MHNALLHPPSDTCQCSQASIHERFFSGSQQSTMTRGEKIRYICLNIFTKRQILCQCMLISHKVMNGLWQVQQLILWPTVLWMHFVPHVGKKSLVKQQHKAAANWSMNEKCSSCLFRRRESERCTKDSAYYIKLWEIFLHIPAKSLCF